MPINYKLYHPLWHRISRFVRLIRAGNHCEQCGVANYTVRHYYKDKVVAESEGLLTFQEARKHLADWWASAYLWENEDDHRFSVVVLTVAHLDHDINNNELENLQALCQACHLGHDRTDNADRRRYGKKGRHYNQIRLNLS